MSKKNKVKIRKKLLNNIALLLFFVIVMLIGDTIMRRQLLANANELNSLLLSSYSASEEDKQPWQS